MVKEKTPLCPCVSPTALMVPRAKAGIRFQKAKVLRILLEKLLCVLYFVNPEDPLYELRTHKKVAI
jgi:hypothetical protein